jgi:methionine-rich copper-binding protein CopC
MIELDLEAVGIIFDVRANTYQENNLKQTISTKFMAVLVFALSTALLNGCASSSSYTPLTGAEPALDSDLTRAPRTLRLFYDALPVVDSSSLTLTGPSGEHKLRGLHTMGMNDLMIEILDPVTEGEYLVEWVTKVGDDPATYSGSFTFRVQGE